MVAQVTAYYVRRGSESRESALHEANHRIAVPREEYGSAGLKSWPITATLVMTPGRCRISVGVRDQLTGVAGYAALAATEDGRSSDAFDR